MADLAAVRVVVYGRVQGVFFRAFASREARGLGLGGYVRNLPSGDAVEVVAEGERDKLDRLMESLRVGPWGAVVERVEAAWLEYRGDYAGFSVRY